MTGHLLVPVFGLRAADGLSRLREVGDPRLVSEDKSAMNSFSQRFVRVINSVEGMDDFSFAFNSPVKVW